MHTFRQAFLALLLILPAFTVSAEAIDINTADKATLMQIQGVGSARADAIIDYREQYGPFMSIEELTEVQGIGQKTLEDNRDSLIVGNPE